MLMRLCWLFIIKRFDSYWLVLHRPRRLKLLVPLLLSLLRIRVFLGLWARHLQIVVPFRMHLRSRGLRVVLWHIFNVAASAFFHYFLRRRQYDLASVAILWMRRQSHVILIILVPITFHCFRLHAKTCFLLVLKHGLDQFSHDSSFLCLYLIDLNLIFLSFWAHLVEFLPEVMTFFIELRFLAEVQLLRELGLILTLPQLLFEREARVTRHELLLVLVLQFLA